MQKLVQYISYFMAVIGAVTVIWRIAVSFQKADDMNADNTQEIIEIRNEMITRTQWYIFTDSVYNHNYRMRNSVEEIKKSLNNLRNSYVSYLRNDESLTKDDFLRYMEGIEFELKKKPDNSSWKIPLLQND